MTSLLQVYTMRDLNPLQFFRGPAADIVGELPERKPELTKKPMTKVPSLLFDMEVRTFNMYLNGMLTHMVLHRQENRCC